MARHHTVASLDGARHGYRAVRAELDGRLLQKQLDAVLAAYLVEGKRLAANAKAIVLVEHALRDDTVTREP